MRDIYEAIERHSATLALYVEHLARARGFAARTLPGMIIVDGSTRSPRWLMLYGADVSLPLGRAASFVPAPLPRVDGDSWMIDVRRSDGVSRPDWNRGIGVRKKDGAYKLVVDTSELQAEALGTMLDSLATP